MLRGLSFQWNDVETFFQWLDALTDISAYKWYVDDVELSYFDFLPCSYSGSQFKNAFHILSRLSFMRIRQYPCNASVNTIDTYEDYAKSDCNALILFYDGGFYEIYAKEETLVHEALQSCVNNGFKNVEFIDDAPNERDYMHF